ncbi:laminin subunit gamma-1-like [Branchiostoma lanceolatum]|uniref:laminin subunit gamma-1-like n=1 Tax=Branchiostoma lanceolatum TaxID=7740 RepID=UPI00345582F7
MTECLPCLCDVGGTTSLNTSCDGSMGQCDCRPNLQGLRCNQTQDGYYVPGLDFIMFEAEGENTETNCRVVDTELPATVPFTGRGFVSCNGSAAVTFNNVEVEQNWFYALAVRHTADNSTTLSSVNVQVFTVGSSGVNGSSVGNNSIRMNDSIPTNLTVDGNSTEQVSSLCPYETGLAYSQNITLTAGVGQVSVTDPVQLDRRCRYQVSVHLDGASAPVTVDSLLLIPDVTKSIVYELADNSTKGLYQDCVRSSAPLPTGDTARTEQCQQMVFSLSVQVYDGARACDCDPVGTVGGSSDCSDVGGQCRCKPGAGGTRCDTCIPGYHSLSQEGCSACNCSDLGSVHLVCDLETGQCPCHPGVSGASMLSARNLTADLQCRSCQLDYFGFESGEGCHPCLCNETGSVSLQCDETGQCPCTDTIGGDKCDVCLPGFFNFSSQGCSPCGCDEAGSEVMTCDQTEGSCTCKFNVEGEECNTCRDTTFNLATWNPDGCQDCFCFNHTDRCTSAVGILLQNITVDVNSSDIITEDEVSSYNVSGTLVGDHTRSYGLNLVLTLDLVGGDDDEVSTNGLVELEGAGFSLVNWGREILQVQPRSNASGSPAALQEISLLLHEAYWNISKIEPFLEAVYFNRLLSDLTSVKVPRHVGNTTVTLHRVVLQTAVAIADSTLPPVLSVENCSCPDGLSGLSCDECSPGYHRDGELNDRFVPCVPCDCNNNTLTSPPQCDAITGECLNCKPGRTGKHCELCDNNVEGPDCDRCAENTYGLDNPDFPGCKNCSCSPLGSVNGSCDQENGQCYCSNSTEGLKCDQCRGNFYYNETFGCIECEGCYDQIETRTIQLRLLRDNITQFVDTLTTGADQNVWFSTRLETVQSQVTGLYNRSQETEDMAAEMHETLDQLNASAQEVLLGLEVAIESEVAQIEGLLGQALGNFTSGQAERNNTVEELKRAYNVINNSLPSVSTELDNLVGTLNQTLAAMAAIQGEVNSSISMVLDTLGDIQTSALQAFQLVQQAQLVASNAVTLHQNTTELIQLLNQTALNISTSLDSETDQVQELYGTVSNATRVAMETERSVNSTRILPTQEVEDLIDRSMGLQERAENLTQQVTNGTSEDEATSENIQQALQTTAQLDGEVLELQDDSLYDRSSQAFTEAQAAVQRAQDNFTAAEDMLNVLQNFPVWAQESQMEVNASLQQVEQVQSGSQAATQQVQQLQEDLQSASGTAQTALQLVENMQGLVNNQSQVTAEILSQAEALNTSAAALPSPGQAAGNVSAANSSRVPTMQQGCSNLTQDTGRLQGEVIRVGGQVNTTNRLYWFEVIKVH